MASRKMTFTISDEVARQFLKRVPARDRSRYVTEALARRLHEREEALIRSCEMANSNSEVGTIEQEWDDLRDDAYRLEEAWSDAPAR